MPFCTSCGKEIPAGKKFCEFCGTPVEQPAVEGMQPPPAPVPPAPVPSSPTPPGSPGGSGRTLLVVGIVIIIAIIAAVVMFGVPGITGSQGSGATPTQATPLPPTIIAATPVPVSTMYPVAARTPFSVQTYEQKYTETYNQVYYLNHEFIGGQKTVFSQDVTTPPLYIKFNITPEMYFGEKTVDIGLASERIVNASYPSPNAWFKVKVFEAGNGELVEEQGFNKEHGVTTSQEFMVRAPGNYRVEMSGNDVIAEVRILTGR